MGGGQTLPLEEQIPPYPPLMSQLPIIPFSQIEISI